MYDVIRNFGVDYIYFDTAFVAVFLFLLIKNKKLLPLAAFFVGGLLINFFVDWGIWLHSGIREIVLPHQNPANVILFFLWFSLSYGVEYAYVFLMFENTPILSKIKWTALVFFGWILTAVLSQNLQLNDAGISTIRHMSDMRLLRLGIVILGFGILFLKKYEWKKILFLFFVGFLIHFMMEFALLVSGIRPGSFWILAENSLIEFNMGVPFFYLIYQKLNKEQAFGGPKSSQVS